MFDFKFGNRNLKSKFNLTSPNLKLFTFGNVDFGVRLFDLLLVRLLAAEDVFTEEVANGFLIIFCGEGETVLAPKSYICVYVRLFIYYLIY